MFVFRSKKCHAISKIFYKQFNAAGNKNTGDIGSGKQPCFY